MQLTEIYNFDFCRCGPPLHHHHLPVMNMHTMHHIGRGRCSALADIYHFSSILTLAAWTSFSRVEKKNTKFYPFEIIRK